MEELRRAIRTDVHTGFNAEARLIDSNLSAKIPAVVLRKGEDLRVRRGHLWIFSNEISQKPTCIRNGELVRVLDARGIELGCGFYNEHSLIAVRLFSTVFPVNAEELLFARIRSAAQLRTSLFGNRDAFRLVFSESDLLPGLIIDKYNTSYVLQINSAGMELYAPAIAAFLTREFSARNIFTKNDTRLRIMEGLTTEDTVYSGSRQPEKISDGPISYHIDFGKSQKTGFFFDQAENRKQFGAFVKGQKVLDLFCNSGGFGLHALAAGAAEVFFVDASNTELENVRRNLSLNNFNARENCRLAAADAFDFLDSAIRGADKFDAIMLDPPGFAKSKKDIKTAAKGYEKLHRLAFRLVNENAIIGTASCSRYMAREEFLALISAAAAKEGKRLQLLYLAGASPDHPVLAAMPETDYLKFFIFRVLKT